MKNENVRNLTVTAMFIAVGIILPFFTGQIPKIGAMMLPMHLPVLLCGLICGPRWGAAAGAVTPLLRSALFHFPVLYPNAVCMAFELLTYGLVAGYVYQKSRWQCVGALYRALISAMILGRVVWAAAETVLLGLAGTRFTFEMFLSSSILNAIPGIVIQLVFIPAVMVALDRTRVVRFRRDDGEEVLT